MPVIQTPLAQVLNPIGQNGTPQPGLFAGLNAGRQQGIDNKLNQDRQDVSREQQDNANAELKNKQNLQRLSNIAMSSNIGLNIIESDPDNAQENLKRFLLENKKILKSLDKDTTQTDEAIIALNNGGVAEAQELMQSVLQTAQAQGGRLPKSNIPPPKFQFAGIGEDGRLTQRIVNSDQSIFDTGIEVPEKKPLVSIGGKIDAKDNRKRFGELFDRRTNIDKSLRQISNIRKLLGKDGTGLIGKSGKITKGVDGAFAALGGLAKNFGLGTDKFDTRTSLFSALEGTKLGDAAVKNAKLESLITDLAFAKAREQNGNGKITDPDFRIAVRSISAKADSPKQLIGVMEQLGRTSLEQFDKDVEATGSPDAFNFSKGQFKSLRNISSKKEFDQLFPVEEGNPLSTGKDGIPANGLPEGFKANDANGILHIVKGGFLVKADG